MKISKGTLGRLRSALPAAALAAALAAGPLLADGPGGGGGMGGGHRGGRALRRALASLDLTQAQKDGIKAAVQGERDAMQALRAQMKDDARQLHAIADTQGADAASVGRAFLKVKSDRDALKAERQKIRGKIEAVLTPDQKTKLEGYLSALKDAHPRRGRGGNGAD